MKILRQKPRKPNIKFEKGNRQKTLIQFQLFIFYEIRLFTETTIHQGIFSGRALWADSGPLGMSTIVPRDQFKPMRIGENLVVNCNLRYFSREMGQFQSIWVRFRKDKTMRPHVNMSTPCRHVNISPCLWLQLVTEVPVGIWNRDKFKLNIDRSVKTPWQEYGVVADSWMGTIMDGSYLATVFAWSDLYTFKLYRNRRL